MTTQYICEGNYSGLHSTMVNAADQAHVRYQNICNHNAGVRWSARFRNILINVLIIIINKILFTSHIACFNTGTPTGWDNEYEISRSLFLC